MADGVPRHRTYYEGDDDGSVLLLLAAEGLLPPDLEVVQRDHRRANPGKEGMVKDIAALVNPAGGAARSAVVIRDIDELSVAQVRDWFIDRMNAELAGTAPPVQVLPQAGAVRVLHFRIEAPGAPHAGRVVVVPVGLAGGVSATEYEIAQFAIDDYILCLARDQAVYDSVSEFKAVPHNLALKKLREVVSLMKNNGLPIKHTKRLMHLLRAVTGFRASPATFAERLIREGLSVLGRDRVRDLFLPLIESLEEASRLLLP
jgi:hypothetical protein